MKVSIITAVLNGAETIETSLKSIIEQDYQDIEHIIIDGGSTDKTLDIISRLSSRVSEVVSEPDKGLCDAMNKGIQLAKGDIIGILNADDFYADRNVISMVAKAFQEPAVDSCYGDLYYVDRTNTDHVIRHWKSCPYNDKLFYRGWMPAHPTFFVRKQVYENYGLYNLDLGTAGDYELMLRFLLKYNITSCYIPKVLVNMRMGGNSNNSLKNRIKANINDRKAWKINGLKPKPWTLFIKPLSKISQYF